MFFDINEDVARTFMVNKSLIRLLGLVFGTQITKISLLGRKLIKTLKRGLETFKNQIREVRE